ncbi:MAG: phenylalanine--tRNA ligase subunit alpha, partial [Gammaproteobacteria bacterium]|nr:phenylalanine--tRNA ligase subunit alpha [Gammaproteobacteria bacterium]
MQELESLAAEAKDRIAAAEDLAALDQVRVDYLGKKGAITAQLKSLGKLPAEERRDAGQKINAVKQDVQAELDARKQALESKALEQQLASETVDVTLPGRGHSPGGLHPATRIIERISELFRGMGFGVETGPEIEDDFHNFDALNFKPDHPARADMDTFYLEDGRLLRTHTSPVQIRAMLKRGAPIRVIAPGRTYRHDYDVTHTP